MILNDKTASHALIRTNPKISGNVKITIDSKGDLYLNSFDANKELADTRFKKFRISPESQYYHDLYKFFDNGKTPADIVFSVKEETPNPLAPGKELSSQYDFFYAKGVSPYTTKLFDETYSYLAPLWLGNIIPDYFVIFRIDSPLDYPYNVTVASGSLVIGEEYKVSGTGYSIVHNTITYNDGDTFTAVATSYTESGTGSVILLDENKDLAFSVSDQFRKVITESKIIKTFDLREDSKIGKYIRNLRYNSNFPSASLNIKFEKDVLSTWNGISYKDGIMTAKGEYLSDFWSQAQTQISFEEYITNGFTRHGVIDPHLLNLEFLFEDEDAEQYSIPRYFGMYVSSIETGTFQLDGQTYFDNRLSTGNLPIPKRPIRGFAHQTESFIQTNEDGLKLYFQNETGFVPNSGSDFDSRVYWLQDKSGNFHSIDNTGVNTFNTSDKDIKIKTKSLDLSLLSGSDDVKYQGKGATTSKKGNSYFVLKINGDLVPNDKIILNWPLGQDEWTASTTGPSGTPAQGSYWLNRTTNAIHRYDTTSGWVSQGTFSSATGGIPFKTSEITANDLSSIDPEWGPGSNLDSIYFHPYGTPNQIATAIAGAFNAISYKQFDAVVINDEVVFRVMEEGKSGNEFFMMHNITVPSDLTMQTDQPVNFESVYFEGGNDNANVRLIFDIDAADRLVGDTYIKTVKGLSKISHIGRYVDVLTLDAGQTPIDIENFNKSMVLHIENIEDSPALGTTKNFLAYSLYQAPVGLFSFFNIKEIDGDFWGSEYNRTPINEYHRYFNLSPNEDVLIDTRGYIVKGDGIIEYDGVQYTADSDGVEFTATNISPNKFTIVSGAPIVFSKLFAVQKGTEWFIEDELKSFPGFSTLKDFSSANETITDSLEYQHKDKFFYKNINNEYDYLKENFNKDLSIKSRLFPSISKWVFKGGTDVRDNPYRLNTLPVFGPLNFSPAFNIKTQDPSAFTHEWYYLESAPQQYPDVFKKDNYYFFDSKLNYTALTDTSSVSTDEFTNYFTYTPIVNTEEQERYSIFSYNSETGVCETFFRGVKISIKDVLKSGKSEGIKPAYVLNSKKYDGYKFSVLLRVKPQNNSIIESPVTYEVVENRKYKNITVLIDVIIDDYRTKDITALPGTTPYDVYVDNILLYSLKSKIEEYITDYQQIGDIKLSFGLNLSVPSTSTYIYAFPNPNYDWDVRDEIHSLSDSNYYFEGTYFYGNTEFPQPKSVDQYGIVPENTSFLASPGGSAPLAGITIPIYGTFEWSGFPVFQKSGGNLYFEPILQRISFGRIADKINNFNSLIKYKSFDGGSSTPLLNEFYIELEEPSTIIKKEAIIPALDEEKPEELKNEPIIGVNLNKIDARIELLRYSGLYEPKFRSLLYFKDQKSDSIVDTSTIDLKFQQATFNPDIENFGVIKNMGILKVADKNILQLSKNNKYPSVYPLIGEIAVDKRNLPIFQSNWDPGFYRRYASNLLYDNLAGTREMKEVKNFLGAKIMKTPKTLKIETFTTLNVESINDINLANYTENLIYDYNKKQIRCLINVEERFLDWLITDGAGTEFYKYLVSEFGIKDPKNMDEDVKEYLRLNILPQYQMEQLNMYIKKTGKNISLNNLVVGTLTDAQKLTGGYVLDKNIAVQKKSNFIYSFEFTFDPSYSYSLSPTIIISKI